MWGYLLRISGILIAATVLLLVSVCAVVNAAWGYDVAYTIPFPADYGYSIDGYAVLYGATENNTGYVALLRPDFSEIEIYELGPLETVSTVDVLGDLLAAGGYYGDNAVLYLVDRVSGSVKSYVYEGVAGYGADVWSIAFSGSYLYVYIYDYYKYQGYLLTFDANLNIVSNITDFTSVHRVDGSDKLLLLLDGNGRLYLADGSRGFLNILLDFEVSNVGYVIGLYVHEENAVYVAYGVGGTERSVGYLAKVDLATLKAVFTRELGVYDYGWFTHIARTPEGLYIVRWSHDLGWAGVGYRVMFKGTGIEVWQEAIPCWSIGYFIVDNGTEYIIAAPESVSYYEVLRYVNILPVTTITVTNVLHRYETETATLSTTLTQPAYTASDYAISAVLAFLVGLTLVTVLRH